MLRGWFFRPATLIASAFVVSILVLAPYVPYLLPDLTEQPEYQFRLDQLHVNAPNKWVPATLLDEVLRESGLPGTVSLLERDVCRKVAEALEQHPWVRRVESVRITGSPGLRGVLEYRSPVAFVETPGGLYPVDVEGVLLPPVDFSLADTERLPHIQNVATSPRGGAGGVWGDVVVLSAAKLADVLAPEQNMERYWRRFGLRAIIAPEADRETATPRDLTFELATEGGSRIVWGKPPGADDLEPTVEQKLGRMEQYLSRFGDFDSPSGPYRIDIRLFDAISLQPLERRSYH